MAYFKIKNQDFSGLVSSLKVGYETLVSDSGGTTANGTTVVDVVNKKMKVDITLRHTTDEEMSGFLAAIDDYVYDITFRDPKTKVLKTITVCNNTPEPEYYTIQSGFVIYKPLSINFSQL